jgi:hypothetical protein
MTNKLIQAHSISIEAIYNEAISTLDGEIQQLYDLIDHHKNQRNLLVNELSKFKQFDKENGVVIIENKRNSISEIELKQLSKLQAVKALRDPNNKINLLTAKRMIEASGFYDLDS